MNNDLLDDDPRIEWGRVRRRIDELKRAGERVPEALIRQERALSTECAAQSQGR